MVCPQVTAATPSFEEVALRLVGANDSSALQIFLLTKLNTLGPSDKAQVHPKLHHSPLRSSENREACFTRMQALLVTTPVVDVHNASFWLVKPLYPAYETDL